MFKFPVIYAIVLAWNYVEDTIECLASLEKTTYGNFKIILVDNGSSDGTSKRVKTLFPDVIILTLEENVGIARGYNAGINFAYREGGEYFLIINNDTTVSKSMVNNLHLTFKNDPTIGVSMPKIYHYFGDRNRLWCAGAKWRNIPPGIKLIAADKKDSLAYSKAFDIEYAPSCCLLIKRSVIEHVGLFDPAFFFYFDDWDYSDRVRQRGYRIVFEPKAIMWHKVSLSTLKNKKPSTWWFAYGQSSARYFLKHKSRGSFLFFSFWFLCREMVKFRFNRILPFLHGTYKGLRGQTYLDSSVE
jgi:GT2 family glycosyltransferase